MIYIFDDIILPSGKMRLRFINDDGNVGTTNNCNGDFVMTMSTLKETIEENGIGGVPRLSNMEFEVLDRAGKFHDGIFNCTKCYADIRLEVEGTEYQIFYGTVDLGSVEYTQIYQNIETTEYTCKFIVISIFGELQNHSVSDVRGILNTSQFLQLKGGTTGEYYGYLRDVIYAALSFIDTTKDVYVSGTPPYKVGYGSVQKYPTDCAMYFKLAPPPSADAFSPAWKDNEPKSFMSFGNISDFIKNICGTLLVYPIVTYDNSNDSIYVTLKSRYGGDIIAPASGIISETERRQLTYDGIKVYTNNAQVNPTSVYCVGNAGNLINGDEFNTQLDLTQQKIEIENRFMLFEQPIYDHNGNLVNESGGDVRESQINLYDSDLVNRMKLIVDQDGIVGTFADARAWNKYLLLNFMRYWATTKRVYGSATFDTNVQGRFIERTYVGCGIGGSYPIALLNRLAIGDRFCPIIDVERDFVANTCKVSITEY